MARAATPEQPTADHVNEILFVLLLAGASFALAQTLVLPALPALGRDLDASASSASWILTGFLLSASVATPIVGKLGDLYGKGRILTIVMALFSVGAVINALAGSLEVLIAGRVLQGVAGGVFPLAFGIVRDSFPPRRLATGLGIMSAVIGIGAGIGLPLSGVIVDHASVQWLFWINLALSVPAAIAAHRLVPPSPVVPHARIDWPGTALLSVALVALLLAVTRAGEWGWLAPATVGLFAVGLAVLGLWVLVEARVPEPFMDLGLLRTRAVAATNLTGFLVGLALFAAFVLVPEFAQAPTSTGYGFGSSVTVGGLLVAPAAAAQLAVGPFTGRIGLRIGFRVLLVLGTTLISAGFALMAIAHSQAWEFLVAATLFGAGIAMALGAMTNIIVAATPREEVGVATGINTIMRTMGGAFGVAVTTAILTDSGDGGLPTASGYTLAFLFSTVVGLLSMAAALIVPRDARQGSAGLAGVTTASAPRPPDRRRSRAA